MSLNIDPRAINEFVADAIIKSALGEALRAAIEREVDKLKSQYNNPFDAVINQHLHRATLEILATEYGGLIREKLAAALARKLTDEFISDVCEKVAERYK